MSNTRCFTFNLIYLSIKSSFISYVSNVRYFIFNTFHLNIICIFFNNIIFTASLSLLKSTGTGTNLSTSNLSTLLFKLLKLVGRVLNLSISDSCTSDFKLVKSVFLAKEDVSTPFAFLNLFLLHN